MSNRPFVSGSTTLALPIKQEPTVNERQHRRRLNQANSTAGIVDLVSPPPSPPNNPDVRDDVFDVNEEMKNEDVNDDVALDELIKETTGRNILSQVPGTSIELTPTESPPAKSTTPPPSAEPAQGKHLTFDIFYCQYEKKIKKVYLLLVVVSASRAVPVRNVHQGPHRGYHQHTNVKQMSPEIHQQLGRIAARTDVLSKGMLNLLNAIRAVNNRINALEYLLFTQHR